METVRITLQRYNRSWDLSRETLIQTFPESILSQALQDDPNVPEIIIENPDVTPTALDVIANYLIGILPTKHVPEVEAAEQYLNMPDILPLAYPEYDAISSSVQKTHVWDSPATQNILKNAVQTGDITMIEYLLWLGITPGKLDIYNFPEKTFPINTLLYAAILDDQGEVFIRLLQDGRVFEETTLQEVFELAILLDAVKIAQYLSEQNPDVNWKALMKSAMRRKNLEMVKILSPHLPGYQDWFLSLAIQWDALDIFKWLLADPYYRPYLEQWGVMAVSLLPARRAVLYQQFLTRLQQAETLP